ncbi:MAG TPA: hypothetical protein VJS38_13525 [Phenylobacterium sp.]|uniref:hypothetical protein n=1 Tax=Phenylobacterium sp. TaxID=1871053 RepID=UPI002B479206|nr:hypothetical protein [Phenylobacterium sp.]HKR89186.1 hypothetical protein [Phenylobacterium sp.]
MDTALRPVTPANANEPPEPQAAWREHCLQMAYSTEALAHWCDEAEMMNAYLELAAKWKAKADRPQPSLSA